MSESEAQEQEEGFQIVKLRRRPVKEQLEYLMAEIGREIGRRHKAEERAKDWAENAAKYAREVSALMAEAERKNSAHAQELLVLRRQIEELHGHQTRIQRIAGALAVLVVEGYALPQRGEEVVLRGWAEAPPKA